MKKYFSRQPSLEHLTVLDTDVVLKSYAAFALLLHVDFTLTASDFCNIISVAILKPTIRNSICREEEKNPAR